MKDSLRPGVSRTERITVDRDRTIGFMGEEARVYATPRLVSDIEITCRNLILEHADPGEDSVGMEIALKHLAPSRYEVHFACGAFEPWLFEGTTFPRWIHPDHATALVDRPGHDGQAQSGSLSRLFRGEERIEDPLPVRLGHARTIIRHEQDCARTPDREGAAPGP